MIHPLPADVRKSIRSGIAIATVNQCVEELVLNSLDAGAGCVAVRIDLDNYHIRVVDNGAGITRSDLEKVGQRYMTSKCRSAADLSRLVFHGYRGEALASIVDVAASVELQTRKRATYKKLITGEGGRIVACEESRASVGTTITVTGLFDRFPVRRKSMKHALEKVKIISLLQSLTLVYPQVTFSLRDDNTGTILYQSKRHSSLTSAFDAMFGAQVDGEMFDVSISKDEINVHCYVSPSPHWDRNLQFVYVNHRRILHSLINDTMNELLRNSAKFRRLNKETAPTSRVNVPYPVFVVLVKMPFSEYDITFDPDKTFVEFHDWGIVRTCLSKAVDRFLEKDPPEETSSSEREEKQDRALMARQEIRLDDLQESLFSKPACRPKPSLVLSSSIGESANADEKMTVSEAKSISPSDGKKSPSPRRQENEGGSCGDSAATAVNRPSSDGDKQIDGRYEGSAVGPVGPVPQTQSGDSIPASLHHADVFPSTTSVPESLVVNSDGPVPESAILHRSTGGAGPPRPEQKRRAAKSDKLGKIRRDRGGTRTVSTEQADVSGLPDRADRVRPTRRQGAHNRRPNSSRTGTAGGKVSAEPNHPLHHHRSCKRRADERIMAWIRESETVSRARSARQGRAARRKKRRGRKSAERVMGPRAPDEPHARPYQSPTIPPTHRKRIRPGNLSQNQDANEVDKRGAETGTATEAHAPDESVRRKLNALQCKVKNLYQTLTRTPEASTEAGTVTPRDQRVEMMSVGAPVPGKKTTYHLRLQRHRRKTQGKRASVNGDGINADSAAPAPSVKKTINDDGLGIGDFSTKRTKRDTQRELRSSHPASQSLPFNASGAQADSNRPNYHPVAKTATEMSCHLLPEQGYPGDTTSRHRRRTAPSVEQRRSFKSPRTKSSGVYLLSTTFLQRTPYAVKRQMSRSELTVAPGQSPYFKAPSKERYRSNLQYLEKESVQVESETCFESITGDDAGDRSFMDRTFDSPFPIPETPFDSVGARLIAGGNWSDRFEINFPSPQVDQGLGSNPIEPEAATPAVGSAEFVVWTPKTEDIVLQLRGREISQACQGMANPTSVEPGPGSLQSVSDASNTNAVRSPKYRSARKRWLTRWESEADKEGLEKQDTVSDPIVPLTLEKSDGSPRESLDSRADSVDKASSPHPEISPENGADTAQSLGGLSDSVSNGAGEDCPSYSRQRANDGRGMEDDSAGSRGGAASTSGVCENEARLSGEAGAAQVPADALRVGGQKWLVITDSRGRHVYVDSATGNSRLERPTSPEPGVLDSAVQGRKFTSHPILSYGAAPFQPRSKDERHLRVCDQAELEKIMTGRRTSSERERGIKWRCVTHEGLDHIRDTLANWQNPVFERDKNILDICLESTDVRYVNNAPRSHTFVKSDFADMEVLRQVDEKFIACVLNTVANGKRLRFLVLIDQHAAHERVRLEMLTENLLRSGDGTLRSTPVEPVRFTLPHTDSHVLKSYQRKIAKLGLEFAVTNDEIEVTSVPYCFVNSDRPIKPDKDRIRSLINEIVQTCKNCRGALGSLPQTVQELLWSQACHGAIKFGDKLTEKECADLINSLGTCDLPFQCAHGRPSLVPLLDVLELDNTLRLTYAKPNLAKLYHKMERTRTTVTAMVT